MCRREECQRSECTLLESFHEIETESDLEPVGDVRASDVKLERFAGRIHLHICSIR